MDKKYFYGYEISEYGVQHNRVDYGTLAKCFDGVLCNDVAKLFYSTINGEYTESELYNGTDYDEENDYCYDVYQYYIISGYGAEILKRYTDEIIWYIEPLDMYIWGVTHFGTSWDYVLTEIKIDEKGE